MAIFRIKNSDISHISAQNIDCGYSLELPRWGSSNEYPQSMFLSRNNKNNVYPCKPQFYYIKVGFKGSKLYRYVFVMITLIHLHGLASSAITLWTGLFPIATCLVRFYNYYVFLDHLSIKWAFVIDQCHASCGNNNLLSVTFSCTPWPVSIKLHRKIACDSLKKPKKFCSIKQDGHQS